MPILKTTFRTKLLFVVSRVEEFGRRLLLLHQQLQIKIKEESSFWNKNKLSIIDVKNIMRPILKLTIPLVFAEEEICEKYTTWSNMVRQQREAPSAGIPMPEVIYQTMICFVLWLVAFFGEFWIGVFQLPWKQPFIIACISFTFIHCILFLCVIFSWVNSENKFSGRRRERSKADKRGEQHKQQHGQLQKVKVNIVQINSYRILRQTLIL